MNCPRDTTSLDRKRAGETDVESCPECRGMFLEAGELDRIAEPHAGDLEYSTLEGDSLAHDDAYGVTACPRDGSQMSKVEFNIYTGIILDYCAQCEAFWLDAREIDRINDEVLQLNKTAPDQESPAMLWFAQFIWALPR